MKLKPLALIIALFFVAPNFFAQRMIQYNWDTYNTKFKIPETFNVETNNSEKFSAGDDDVWLTIYPKSGEKVSYSNMKKYLEDWAYDSGVHDYSTVYELDNLNGYWGVYLEGTKSSNSLPAFLMLVVHPDYLSQRLYVWINYKKSALDTAEKILKSFTPTY